MRKLINKTDSPSLITIALFLIIALIWGSSFILVRLGLYHHCFAGLLPYQVAAISVVSAGLVFFRTAISGLKRLELRMALYLFCSGMFGVLIPSFLICYAETKLDRGIAGVLNASTPIFVMIFGLIFDKLLFSRRQFFGVLIGSAGILLVFCNTKQFNFENFIYSCLILIATLSCSVNILIVRYRLNGLSALTITAVSMAMLSPFGLLVLGFSGYFTLPMSNYAYLVGTGASILLGVLCTATAWTLFYRLVKQSNTVFASSVTFVVPIVAVGWGLCNGERISVPQILSSCGILVGVYFIKKEKEKLA